MEKVSCVVIGAGAVGLAIGKTLAECGVASFVLERHSAFGTENSSRNSEVLHAGMYYTPGSLKAKLCFEGRSKLVSYLQQRHINHKRCGKLIIASNTAEIETLHQILANGRTNGLLELQILNEEQTYAMEPSVVARAALFSPFTSIFDSHDLMLNFQSDMESASSTYGGGDASMVVFNCKVHRVDIVNSTTAPNRDKEFIIETSQGCIRCDFLVNAAGLSAQYIAHSNIVGYPKNTIPPLYMAKGNYYKLTGHPIHDPPFKHLIYPVPKAGGLGVHATLDLNGSVRFGPDIEWIPSSKKQHHQHLDPYLHSAEEEPEIDFAVNGNLRDVFFDEIRKYWSAIHPEQLEADYAGIRTKPVGPTTGPLKASRMSDNSDSKEQQYKMKATADFMIHGSRVHGIQGLVNLFGIESPGLTSSLAIAEYVRDLLFNDRPRS